MSERLSTVCVAYTKGVKAHRKTKRELASWWNAGYHDSSKNNIDYNYFKSDVVSTEQDEQ